MVNTDTQVTVYNSWISNGNIIKVIRYEQTYEDNNNDQ